MTKRVCARLTDKSHQNLIAPTCRSTPKPVWHGLQLPIQRAKVIVASDKSVSKQVIPFNTLLDGSWSAHSLQGSPATSPGRKRIRKLPIRWIVQLLSIQYGSCVLQKLLIQQPFGTVFSAVAHRRRAFTGTLWAVQFAAAFKRLSVRGLELLESHLLTQISLRNPKLPAPTTTQAIPSRATETVGIDLFRWTSSRSGIRIRTGIFAFVFVRTWR